MLVDCKSTNTHSEVSRLLYKKTMIKTQMRIEEEPKENQSPLPPEKMPSCWNQEERMNALFSPFRSRSVNPQDWISKHKFWQKLIYDWLSHTMHCTFAISDLNEAFRRKGCRPLCLTTVVEELLRNNEIMQETDFLQEPLDSWTSWSINIFVKKPLAWSFSKLKSYVANTDINEETRYIHLQILREIAEITISVLSQKRDSTLVPFSDLLISCEEKTKKTISENTMVLSLTLLKRMKKVDFTYGPSNEILVKLRKNSEDSITEIDETLYELQRQENKLVKELHLLEEDKINVINETKSYLGQGLRQVAKAHLRKKLELEKTIDKRSQTLGNLRSLISSIQDSQSNTTVLTAYQIGTDALKKLTQGGLSESNVRDVMDDLSEAIEEHKEVGTLLSDSLKNDESDLDLEQELEELLQSEVNVLPEVPNTALNASIDELERSLRNLSVEDKESPAVTEKRKQLPGSKKQAETQLA